VRASRSSAATANAAARHARENEGWRGKGVKVIVDYRGRAPF
jgi:hypothetical protein